MKERKEQRNKTEHWPESVQFTSVQSLDQLGRRGWRGWGGGRHKGRFSRDPLPVYLQEALVSRSDMSREVHSLMSIQHFLCQTRRRPSSKMPRRVVLQSLSWRVTCPNLQSFRLLRAARWGSGGSARKLILLHTQSLVVEMLRRFLRHLVWKVWTLF